MRRLRVPFIVLVSLCAACGSPRRQTVVTTAVAPPAAGPVSDTTHPGSRCESQLSVGPVQTRPGCQIDERVSQQTTTLSHPCSGDGPASAAFADAVFEGGVNGGELDIAIETVFDFSDGCRWRTKQRIQGPLGAGALSYSYEEQPEPGQRGCAEGCVASATAQVR